MQELRFVAVSEDGRYAVLAVPGRSARFTLPIDERLRAVAQGQTSRLVQYEIEVESPLRPKEIQARIRAGETVEEIADAAGIAVERVRWFEGPVLAERAYIADQAQTASVRRQGDAAPSTPGPRLGEIVTERLKMFGSDPEDAQWDAKKRGDGSWQVQLTFISGGRLHVAEWVFDPRRRHVLPADDNAARMSLPGTEPPQPAAPPPGEATVTQLAPRLSTASGQGFGQPGTGTSGFSPAGIGNGGPGNGAFGNAGFGNAGFGNGGPGNGGLGSGGWPRHERPGNGRPVVSEPVPQAPPAPAASVSEPAVDGRRPPASGRHSLAQTTAQEPEFISADPERDDYAVAPEPQVEEAQAAVAPQDPAPAAMTPPAPAATSPVTPAAVAAQVSRAPEAAQTSRMAQTSRPPQTPRSAQGPQPAPGRAPQPTREAQEPRPAHSRPEPEAARPEPEAPAGRPEPALPAARQEAASPAGDSKPAAAASPEPSGEQAGRQSRKAARGKRASVPSWDEIMFGNSRQRD